MTKKPDELIPVTGGNGAGRVEVDSRGRNVWHWEDEQIDSTTILLKRLDNDALQLESTGNGRVGQPAKEPGDDRKHRSRSGAEDLLVSDTLSVPLSGGFDPYNHS